MGALPIEKMRRFPVRLLDVRDVIFNQVPIFLGTNNFTFPSSGNFFPEISLHQTSPLLKLSYFIIKPVRSRSLYFGWCQPTPIVPQSYPVSLGVSRYPLAPRCLRPRCRTNFFRQKKRPRLWEMCKPKRWEAEGGGNDFFGSIVPW